ncbi:MAG: LysR family transcriptional regulator [Pseudobacteriovorax sp.]|nr:LysR family transcriptional regulator [Pseudobacteriovorax sp.]
MVDFRLINSFLVVSRFCSFSRAADELRCTKAKISKDIKNLEEILGVKLIQRSTRSFSLTEIGVRYRERCELIKNQYDELHNEIVHQQTSIAGMIRVGAPASFGRKHVVPLLDMFMSQNPNLEVNLTLSDQIVDPIRLGMDLCFRIAEPVDSSMVMKRIAKNKSILCASPEYLKNATQVRVPEDLTKLDFVLYSAEHTVFNNIPLIFDSKKQLISVRGRYHVNDADVLLDLVLKGRGVGYLGLYHVYNLLRSGQLVQVLPQAEIQDKLEIFALYPSRYQQLKKVSYFLEFICQQWGEPPRWELLR